MSMTGLSTFDDTIHTTNGWLVGIEENLGWSERVLALKALRTTLHLLRDCLPVQVSAKLSAQLPILVRGLYFEGWTADPPDRDGRSLEHLLEPVQTAFCNYPGVDAEKVVAAVFDVIRQHISEGEVEKILHVLPGHLRAVLEQPYFTKPIRTL